MLALLEERQVVAIKLLFEELQEGFLILVPSETILGVTDLKTTEMKLTEKSQAGVTTASRRSEERGRPVAVLATSFNEAAAAEERGPNGNSCLGRARRQNRSPRNHRRSRS